MERATKRKIRTFRTDNGGEYTSTEFENYLKAEGIRHELTVPKTPQQNGIAERLNQTLVEMAQSMLLDSKFSKKFWGEAISTAVYLKNRTPVKALNKTPFEVWHGKKATDCTMQQKGRHDVQFNEKVQERRQNTQGNAEDDYQLIVDFSDVS